MLICTLSPTMMMTLVAPMLPLGQGLSTKFPLIPILIAADGGHGLRGSPCPHIDRRCERGAERLEGWLSLTALGTTSIRQELCRKPPFSFSINSSTPLAVPQCKFSPTANAKGNPQTDEWPSPTCPAAPWGATALPREWGEPSGTPTQRWAPPAASAWGSTTGQN